MEFILYLGAFGAFVNMFLQSYDILWCRWHNCGKSSKNSIDKELDES